MFQGGLVGAPSRLLLLSGLLAPSAGHAQSAPSAGTTPFVLDGNRTYARLGRPTVLGVYAGDKLLQVDQLRLKHANWGAIYVAVHGTPGDVRRLLLDRAGTRVLVQAKVTAF